MAKRYWIYAPGENAEMWDEFYENNIIALGWDSLGDLNDYNSKEEIQAKLQELDNTTESKNNDTLANIEFLKKMDVGDVIFIKRGRRELLGYGEVTSDCYFNGDRMSFKNCRDMKWMKKDIWKMNNSFATKTLTDISEYPDKTTKFKFYYETLFNIIEENLNKMNSTILSLNTILFGPPGTGKTYSTIELAYRAIKGDDAFKKDGYDVAKQWFKNELAKSEDRQLDFITFHQNYSYEDFVMGIKPDLNEGDGLSFNRHEGIFFKICQRALGNLKQSSEEGSTVEPTFNEVFDDFIRPLIKCLLN